MESCILGNNKFGPTFITRFGDASHSESDQGFLTMSYTKAIIVIWFFTLSKFLIRVPFKNKPNNNLIYMKTPEQRTLDIVTQVSMLVHGPHMLNHLFICLLIVSQTTVLIETTSSLRFDDRQNRCESDALVIVLSDFFFALGLHVFMWNIIDIQRLPVTM